MPVSAKDERLPASRCIIWVHEMGVKYGCAIMSVGCINMGVDWLEKVCRREKGTRSQKKGTYVISYQVMWMVRGPGRSQNSLMMNSHTSVTLVLVGGR